MTVDLALRAAALLAVGLVGARALSRGAASTRHLWWRLVMIAVLALPLARLAAPAWSLPGVPVPLPVASLASLVAPGEPDAAGRHAPGVSRPADQDGATAFPVGPTMPAPWAAVPARLWLAGVMAMLCHLAAGHVWLWRRRRRSMPAPAGWHQAAARLAARVRLGALPDIRLCADVPGPMVAGLWAPVLLLPPSAATWEPERRDLTLAHELAHVARRDVGALLVAHLARALHWFNPLAWLAVADMRRACERACDDAVLRTGVPPSRYASALLAMAADGVADRGRAAALAMARPGELEGRLVALLGVQPRATTSAARRLLPALATAWVLVIAGAQAAAPAAATEARPRRAPRPAWSVIPVPLDPAPAAAADADGASSHPDARARERATLALAMTPGARVVPALLDALGDADAGVREKAAVGLAWRRDPRIVPALVDAAGDTDAGVREKVLVALAFSGDERAAAVIDAARADTDAGVRDKARTLATLVGR